MTKPVFALYDPRWPLSLDNIDTTSDYYTRKLLYPYAGGADPSGATAYGGALRDRPMDTAVKTGTPDFLVQNARLEVDQAKSIGIDGFGVLIRDVSTSASAVVDRQRAMFQAAVDQGGFSCFPVLSCDDLLYASDTDIMEALNVYLGYSSTLVLFATKVWSGMHAELFSAARWDGLRTLLFGTHAVPSIVYPIFRDWNYVTSLEYDSVITGYSIEGYRNPAANPTGTGVSTQKWIAAQAQASGAQWWQPVSVQDERPAENIYDEAQNTTNLLQTFQIAIEGGADGVMLQTWNDYAANSGVAPSAGHGWSYADIAAYYIAWFKSGVQPAVGRDVVYLSHRKHATTVSSFTSGQSGRQLLRPGSSSARNSVEALVFLTSAATVNINVNGTITSASASAGISAWTATLAAGTVQAEIVRSGSTVASVLSATTVTATPAVQDLGYYAYSSARDAPATSTTTPDPGATTTNTTAPGDLAAVLVDPGVAATPALLVDGSQRGYGNLTAVKLGNGKGILAWTENDLDTGTDCLIRVQPLVPATDVTGVDDVGSIITNYLGGAVLQRYLIDNPSYLALFTANPTALGLTTNEVVGGSYARLLCTWSAPGTKTSGLGALRFLNLPACTVTHLGVMDALTGGHMLIAKALPAPIPVLSSAELRVGANAIVITL